VRAFRFIAAERANHRIATLCRVLRVSRAGYYAWSTRPPSRRETDDRALTRLIREVHEGSRGTYGAPRIWAELQLEHGMHISRKRVARLMRRARIQGVHVRRRYRTTRRAKGLAPAPDLVGRRFAAAEPDRIWVADISYLDTAEGYLHLAAIEDLFSRAIVGWSMATHLRAELVIAAFDAAIANRRPGPGLVHHSDQGSQGQYTSIEFGRRLRESGILSSMGRVGSAHDNAAMESTFGSMKRELEVIFGPVFPTRDHARSAAFWWIEVFYNRRRRHSFCGQLAPFEFERRWLSAATAS
jgi:putative transposase